MHVTFKVAIGGSFLIMNVFKVTDNLLRTMPVAPAVAALCPFEIQCFVSALPCLPSKRWMGPLWVMNCTQKKGCERFHPKKASLSRKNAQICALLLVSRQYPADRYFVSLETMQCLPGTLSRLGTFLWAAFQT